MLALQMAAYTDGLACFNFTEPFAGMHCDPMLRYVNLTVPVVVVPARSARAERCRLRGECRLRGSAAPAGHQPAAWLGPAPRAHLPPRIPCAMACHPSALLPTPA